VREVICKCCKWGQSFGEPHNTISTFKEGSGEAKRVLEITKRVEN
jgi:hypothetical protein